MHLRAEHLLAVLITGMFLLVDIAVLYFFVSAFDTDPHIVRNHMAVTHGYHSTPELTPKSLLTQTTFGGPAESKADAVQKLSDALSTQIQTLTQPKPAP